MTTTLQQADEDLNYGSIYYTVFPVPAGEVADIISREHNPFRMVVNIAGRGIIRSGLMPDGKGNYFITIR